MSIVFFVPSTYALSYLSIRFSIWVIVIVTVAGSWLACLINSSISFAFAGRLVFAINFPFAKNIITRISSIWFAPHKVLPPHSFSASTPPPSCILLSSSSTT